MNIESTSQNCRIVKEFDPAHKMTKKQVEELISLLLQASPSVNVRKWQFVVVQDEAVRDRLTDAVWDQRRAADATLLIILCIDLAIWRTEPLRYWHSTQHAQLDSSIPVLSKYDQGLDAVQRDNIMRSCGMVTQTLMLVAQSMGLDSCLLEGFDPERVGEAINLPDDHAVCMVAAIGRAADKAVRAEDTPSADGAVVQDTY
ncbi:MAG: nitroreductase family protein [Pontiella sp.]|nr:nitroreductase family protein [Pontiella sp.]NNJ70532.1 nitroreductase family protein [Kiritimatiellales bacterium]